MTGKDVLSPREVRDLYLAEYYDVVIRESMEGGEHWQGFIEANPGAESALEFAVKEYKEWLKAEYGDN